MQKNQSLSPKPAQRQVHTLSRRQVLQLAGLSGTAVAVAACRGSVAVSDEVTRVAKQALIGEGPPGELRVGFGQSDITPPVGAIMTGPRLPRTVGTDDPLLAKTLVVQSGDRTMAIVGLDLVKIRLDLADAAIAQASQRTGIDRDAVMICPTHNHSSPFIPMGGPNNKDYISTLPGLIADSIEQASRRCSQPACSWDALWFTRVIITGG